jgi:hypothetical protein
VEKGLRALKFAVAAMGVMIVLGTAALVMVIVQRESRPAASALPSSASASAIAAVASVLDEPAGTHIVATTPVGNGLAVSLEGGGPDRVVVVDLRTGRTIARISLSR